MKILLGDKVSIDLRSLIVSRLLLQANSGGGKSWALRRLLEQTHGHVQQIVIDPEDEFYTLREKYDYILARHEDGDCVPEVRSAELLATRLLELGVSAIISIYELHPRDRREFVRRFLESLVNAPKHLWHRALIVVDEAHEYCPEQGKQKKGDAVADAVIGLMAKGRKRGFCGILATQRISKLNKDAAAEANNKLIGRAAIDVDRKRAAEELGFTSKEDVLSLRQLDAGEFYAFGPAISRDVIKLKVAGVETTHPKAGAAPTPVAAPKSKVQSVLAKLADLPQEAEQERVTIADLQRKLREFERQRADLQEAARRAAAESRVETKTVYVLKDSQIEKLDKLNRQFEEQFTRAGRNLETLFTSLTTNLNSLFARRIEIAAPINKAVAQISSGAVAQPGRAVGGAAQNTTTVAGSNPARSTTPPPQGGGPTGKLRDIMVALAQVYPNGLNARQIGARASVSTKGGSFGTFISNGRGNGWIDGTPSTLMKITDAGFSALGSFEPLPSGRDLFQWWLAKLGAGKAADIFRVLYEAYPQELTTDQIGELASVSTKGGSFATFMSTLKSRDLVVGGRGVFKASPELFE